MKLKNWSMSCASDQPQHRDKEQSRKASSPTMKEGQVAKAEKVAPGATDFDRPLKLATAQALASAGFYVRTNVVLSEPRAVDGGAWVVDVTDVDVLAVAHGLDFRPDLSCVSCKGGGAVKVLHETFALAGVMQYLRAGRGYAVFSKKNTEPQMIALAEQLGVTLMDDREWRHWRARIAGPFAIPDTFNQKIDSAVADGARKWTNLAPLLRYLRTEFWYYRDYRNIQSLLAQLHRAAKHLNLSPLARYLVLDATALFALAVLQLCEFVNSSGLLRLRDTVPTYLFGGIATYRSRRDLLFKVEELLRKKNVIDTDQAMPRLDPAYLNDLMELILRYCNKPHAATRVPQQINAWAGFAAAKAAGNAGRANGRQRESELTQKLALDLIELVGRAGSLPPPLLRELLKTPTSAPSGGGAPTAPGEVKSSAESAGGRTAPPPASALQVAERRSEELDAKQPDLLSQTKTNAEP